ncbi:DUF1905 domain-containing protein [Lacihabitans sp. LS3-19]|uniref:YdeI/OmpD-associated family protein n=1 Tax=Lacihabitans sp. LS3-19 TaxID=2487335 RepID=UPI0020CDE890|nr:YdeI/OmpD-associated family protein [Lacihabitans sp. LS3-19]MCP9768684.1 DUF1905 domain-containing protein [Lacihabitans sp. LS3-19]
MVSFSTEIRKYIKNGEKTGWTYIEVLREIADKLKPEVKTSYRVKGTIDKHKIAQVALVPIGEGDFILALNAEMRKHIKKQVGDKVEVVLEVDSDEFLMSPDLIASLEMEPEALALFESFPKGHQRYYSNWVESAKTIETKTKRIYMCLYGLLHKMDYGEMIQHFKKEKQ